MSSLSMRMQPYEANVPIESGRFVPWIAYSPPESVVAATPIGLLGAPPGITSGSFGLSALTSAGGVHAGWTYLPFTWALPCHCMQDKTEATQVGAIPAHDPGRHGSHDRLACRGHPALVPRAQNLGGERHVAHEKGLIAAR